MPSSRVTSIVLSASLLLGAPLARAGLTFVDFSDAGQASDFANQMAPNAMEQLHLPDVAQPGGVLALGSGGSVVFSDPDGNPNTPTVYDSNDFSWWNVPDTHFIGTRTNTIELDFLGMSVVGVEFDLGVRWNSASAWFAGTLSDGSAATSGNYAVSNTGVSRLGLYLDNGAANSAVNGGANACRSITNLTVEPPPNWGVGDIKVYQNSACVSVPEPDAVLLVGLGLVMFALLRRFKGRTG